jgi:hypothetical protein
MPEKSALGLYRDIDDSFYGLLNRFVPVDPARFHRELERLVSLASHDSVLMSLDERWAPGKPDPDLYKPGDISALRSIPTLSSALSLVSLGKPVPMVEERERFTFIRVNSLPVLLIYMAKPYFLPAEAVDAVARTDAPPPEMVSEVRLPFDAVLVVFGADMRLSNPLWPDMKDFTGPPSFANLLNADVPKDLDPGSWQKNIVHAAYDRGGTLNGVVLMAGPNGRGLADEIVWLLSAEPSSERPTPYDLDRQRGCVIAKRSLCLMAPFVDALAVMLDAAAWLPPAPEPPGIGSPWSERWVRSLRRAKAQRALERGAGTGARVIDMRRTRAEAAKHAGAPTGRTLAPHARRGHFRRARVAVRDASGHIVGNVHGAQGKDWSYRTVWVPPVFIHPEDGPGRPQVWRLPGAHEAS